MKIVYRFGVRVDGHWHQHELAGPIVHVDCRQSDLVEFWVLEGEDVPKVRQFKVFGTGEALPSDVTYVGTALSPSVAPLTPYGQLVWHLFERSGEG